MFEMTFVRLFKTRSGGSLETQNIASPLPVASSVISTEGRNLIKATRRGDTSCASAPASNNNAIFNQARFLETQNIASLPPVTVNKIIFTRIKPFYKIALAFTLILFISACGNNSTSTKTADTTVTNANTASTAKTVLFFGDSLTAGYGLDDPSEAFPGVIQQKIDSAKLNYHVVNAGLSGETTAGGRARIGWVLKQKVDVFVLELGANDGLRGIAANETTANLQAIVDTVKARYPQAKLVMLGMQIPPSMGSVYVAQFKTIFPQVAAKKNMVLVPFLLKGVGGVPSLNQKDGIHPTAEGAKIVANNVWQVLHGLL